MKIKLKETRKVVTEIEKEVKEGLRVCYIGNGDSENETGTIYFEYETGNIMIKWDDGCDDLSLKECIDDLEWIPEEKTFEERLQDEEKELRERINSFSNDLNLNNGNNLNLQIVINDQLAYMTYYHRQLIYRMNYLNIKTL